MKENGKNMEKLLREFVPYIIVVIVVLLIKRFIISPIRVNGSSMESTLHDKDIMLLNEIGYRFSDIERFDIVVIHHQDEYLIKRVIGLPGERVFYQDNQLFINGKKVKEPFEHEYTEDVSELMVPEGKYFVLGDNRVNSTDSRILGFFERSQIKGKTNFIVYPFSRFGKKS